MTEDPRKLADSELAAAAEPDLESLVARVVGVREDPADSRGRAEAAAEIRRWYRSGKLRVDSESPDGARFENWAVDVAALVGTVQDALDIEATLNFLTDVSWDFYEMEQSACQDLGIADLVLDDHPKRDFALAIIALQSARFDFAYEQVEQYLAITRSSILDGSGIRACFDMFARLVGGAIIDDETIRATATAPSLGKMLHLIVHGLWLSPAGRYGDILIELCSMILDGNPYDSIAVFRRAEGYRRIGDFESALADIDKAIYLNEGRNRTNHDLFVRRREQIVAGREQVGAVREIHLEIEQSVRVQLDQALEELQRTKTDFKEELRRQTDDMVFRNLEILALFTALAGLLATVLSSATTSAKLTGWERALVIAVGALFFIWFFWQVRRIAQTKAADAEAGAAEGATATPGPRGPLAFLHRPRPSRRASDGPSWAYGTPDGPTWPRDPVNFPRLYSSYPGSEPKQFVPDERPMNMCGTYDVTDAATASGAIFEYIRTRVADVLHRHSGTPAILLSGGVDSTLVAAAVVAEVHDRVTSAVASGEATELNSVSSRRPTVLLVTYRSVGSREAKREFERAQAVAQCLSEGTSAIDVRHIEIEISSREFRNRAERLLGRVPAMTSRELYSGIILAECATRLMDETHDGPVFIGGGASTLFLTDSPVQVGPGQDPTDAWDRKMRGRVQTDFTKNHPKAGLEETVLRSIGWDVDRRPPIKVWQTHAAYELSLRIMPQRDGDTLTGHGRALEMTAMALGVSYDMESAMPSGDRLEH